jgi:hypothetical protein
MATPRQMQDMTQQGKGGAESPTIFYFLFSIFYLRIEEERMNGQYRMSNFQCESKKRGVRYGGR